MTKIIGLAGKKGSGKNTIGEILQSELSTMDFSVKCYALADPLKRIAIDVLGLDENLVYGSDEDKETLTEYKKINFPVEDRLKNSMTPKELKNMLDTPASIRFVLQNMGTQMFRKLDSNIWAKTLIRRILADQPDFAIVTDVRFPNEVKTIYENGGLNFKLTRSIYEDSHASENALNDFKDYTEIIDNANLSLEDQEIYVRNLIHKYI